MSMSILYLGGISEEILLPKRPSSRRESCPLVKEGLSAIIEGMACGRVKSRFSSKLLFDELYSAGISYLKKGFEGC